MLWDLFFSWKKYIPCGQAPDCGFGETGSLKQKVHLPQLLPSQLWCWNKLCAKEGKMDRPRRHTAPRTVHPCVCSNALCSAGSCVFMRLLPMQWWSNSCWEIFLKGWMGFFAVITVLWRVTIILQALTLPPVSKAFPTLVRDRSRELAGTPVLAARMCWHWRSLWRAGIGYLRGQKSWLKRAIYHPTADGSFSSAIQNYWNYCISHWLLGPPSADYRHS